jgi:phosphoribosylformylglycinamidine synthase
MDALRDAMKAGFIASCHDLAEGGLAVAVCEMVLGGDIGATLDIASVNPQMRSDYTLFSESNTRWVMEVWSDEKRRFEELMKTRGICTAEIGETLSGKSVMINSGDKKLVDLSLADLRGCMDRQNWLNIKPFLKGFDPKEDKRPKKTALNSFFR